MILVYALVKAEDFGWGSASTIGLLALSVALIGSFIVIESRSRSPLAPLAFFRNRTPTAANVIAVLVAASLFSMFYLHLAVPAAGAGLLARSRPGSRTCRWR